MPGVITHYKEIQVFFPIIKPICQVSSPTVKKYNKCSFSL